VDSFTLQPSYLREENLLYQLYRRLVGLRIRLAEDKFRDYVGNGTWFLQSTNGQSGQYGLLSPQLGANIKWRGRHSGILHGIVSRRRLHVSGKAE
jgi:hypothetical protein